MSTSIQKSRISSWRSSSHNSLPKSRINRALVLLKEFKSPPMIFNSSISRLMANLSTPWVNLSLGIHPSSKRTRSPNTRIKMTKVKLKKSKSKMEKHSLRNNLLNQLGATILAAGLDMALKRLQRRRVKKNKTRLRKVKRMLRLINKIKRWSTNNKSLKSRSTSMQLSHLLLQILALLPIQIMVNPRVKSRQFKSNKTVLNKIVKVMPNK